jgi:uncharacterized protein YabN with tetrapyrrole methylase and pyrophosphatase domain
MSNWEQIKREEKGRTSAMDGIPGNLPSLLYAHKVQRKAASVGFDWDSVEGAWPKIAEEADELRRALGAAGLPAGPVSPGAPGSPAVPVSPGALGLPAGPVSPGPPGSRVVPAPEVVQEVGDLLFAVVNVARHLNVDPESALRGAAAKFRSRFQSVEALAAERSLDLRTLDLAALDRLWDEVKRSGADSPG